MLASPGSSPENVKIGISLRLRVSAGENHLEWIMADEPDIETKNGPRKFLLRLDPKLWDEIQTWAADDLRSINGQIEYLLRQAVAKRRKPGKDE